LKEALLLQKNKYPDKNLGSILVSLGYVTEDEIYTALALQYAYPIININRYKFNEDVINVLPKEIVLKYSILPLDKFRDILTIAMVNPLDREIIEKVEQITGLKVRVFVCFRKELEEAISMLYKK